MTDDSAPAPILVYGYDSVTKIFCGSDVAHISPMDGEPMVPAFATLIAPGTIAEGQQAVWNGTGWTIEAAAVTSPAPQTDPLAAQKAQLAMLATLVPDALENCITAYGWDVTKLSETTQTILTQKEALRTEIAAGVNSGS